MMRLANIATTASMAGLTGLAGCTVPVDEDGNSPTEMRLVVDDVPMLVEYDNSYIDTSAVEFTDPDTGETSMIEPIATPPMLVAVRNDGQKTTQADEKLALKAVRYFCHRLGITYVGKPRFEISPDQRPVWVMGQTCS